MTAPYIYPAQVETGQKHREFPPEKWADGLLAFAQEVRSATFPGVMFRGPIDDHGSQIMGLHLDDDYQFFEGFGRSPQTSDLPPSEVSRWVISGGRFKVADTIEQFAINDVQVLEIHTHEHGGIVLQKQPDGLGVFAFGVPPVVSDLFWI